MHDRSTPPVELVEITRRFPGVLALDAVSLALAAGEVHALVGENGAGKSTLINVLSGLLAPDAGHVLLAGRRGAWSGPLEARRNGIVTVHQEAELFPTLSVAENMALEQGLPVAAGGWVRWRQVYGEATRAVALLGERIDVRRPAAELSVAERQMAQIAAAVWQRARVLVLDEPTSALTAEETAWLFRQIRRLQADGVGILYVSHRQDEIFELADRITVLRDGRRVWSGPRDAIDPAGLVRHMVGRNLALPDASAKPTPSTVDSPLQFELCHVSDAAGRFTDVSLQVRRGEVVGIYGLVGSGRSELAQAVFGLRPLHAGNVRVEGREVTISDPARAVAAGLAYLPEDRLHQGIFGGLSVRANAVVSALNRLARGPLASAARERAATAREVATLGIKCRDVEQPIAELSGGNQQKVVLARWLLTRPSVLILDEPTRGVDVGAKQEIHRQLQKLASDGAAIVLISSDLPEVTAQSDRVLVFRSGRIVAEFPSSQATPDRVATAALPEPSTPDNTPGERARRRRTLRRWQGEAALAAAIAVVVVGLVLTSDAFLTANNLWGLLATAAVWTILSLAAASVILAGAIDISLGSLFALSAAAGGLVLRLPYEPWVTIPAGVAVALAVGVAGGLTNAALSLWGRVHPIVITLGTMTVYRGLLISITGGDTITDLPASYVTWSSARLLGVDTSAALGAATAVVVYLWLSHSRSGRHVIAQGASPAAARLVGISRTRAWLTAFGVGGLLAALAGMLELSQTGSLQSGTGTGYELRAIAAAVIGGVAISGGRGTVVGVCLGALLLSLIYNALVLWQVSRYQYLLVTGAMLLAAILADRAWRRLER